MLERILKKVGSKKEENSRDPVGSHPSHHPCGVTVELLPGDDA